MLKGADWRIAEPCFFEGEIRLSAKFTVCTETMDFGDWEYPEADWGRLGRAANQGL